MGPTPAVATGILPQTLTTRLKLHRAAQNSGMNWLKLALFAVLIATAAIAAIQWRKLAGAVVLPLTLVALYAVWRWRRDD